MKRLLIVLLTISTILMPIVALAEIEKEDDFRTQEELMYIAQYHISDFDAVSTSNQKSVYYLGTAIPIFFVSDENNERATMLSDVRFYPVYKNDQVIFTILEYEGGTKISSSSVKEINEILSRSNKIALVIESENKSFIGLGNNVSTPLINDVLGSISEIGKTMLQYVSNQTRVNEHQLDMPIKTQGGNTTCWAACMASFLQKYIGGTHTWRSVCLDTIGITETSIIPTKRLTEVQGYFRDIYGISTGLTVVGAANNASAVRLNVGYGNAYILGWSNYTASGNQIGHVTVLSGYSYDASSGEYVYTIMDPQHLNYYVLRDNGNNSTLPTNYNIDDDNLGIISYYSIVERLSFDGVQK